MTGCRGLFEGGIGILYYWSTTVKREGVLEDHIVQSLDTEEIVHGMILTKRVKVSRSYGEVEKRDSSARFGSAPLIESWGTRCHLGLSLCPTSDSAGNMYLQYLIATPLQSGLTKSLYIVRR